MSNEIIKNSFDSRQLASTHRRDETSSVAANGKGARQDRAAAARSSDDVTTLTDIALHVQKVEERLADAPVVSDKRVQEIRQAISDGSYRISAEHIAGKLIELELRLGGSS